MNDNHLDSITNSTIAIFEKATRREEAGRNSFDAGWQASLETMLLMMEKRTAEQPGQLHPMQIDNDKEWEFYIRLKSKLDLPPETCAILITPSAFKSIPKLDGLDIEFSGPKAWERNAYSVIVSDLEDHEKILQASLPGIEHAGIDVFDDGNHLVDYAYNTVEECIDDLTRMVWMHFDPGEEWTDESIIRYTENWCTKIYESGLQETAVHEAFSYLHHPERLNLTPFQAVFRAAAEVISKGIEDIKELVDTTNTFNRDFNLKKPFIASEAVLKGQEPDCRVLLEQIHVEIDLLLEQLEDAKGVNFPIENRRGSEYRSLFDETAYRIYRAVAGRPYPNLQASGTWTKI
jgi:hypothetical protein